MKISGVLENTYRSYMHPLVSHPIAQVVFKCTKEVCSVIAAVSFLELSRALLKGGSPSYAEVRKWTVFLQPVAEEIVYRGIIQNGIWAIQKAKNYIYKETPTEKDLKAQKIFRVGLTALFQGIVESQFEQGTVLKGVSILTKTFEGLTYGFLYERYKTLSIPILFNAVHASLSCYFVDPSQVIPFITSTIALHTIRWVSFQFATKTWKSFKIKVKECALEVAKVAASLFVLIGVQKLFVQWEPTNILNLNLKNVYGPFLEEIIYRGYLQRGIEFIQHSYNTCWKKNHLTETEKKAQQIFRLRVSSFIFGISHIFNSIPSIQQCITSGLGGMAYGYSSEKFQTLSLSILAHGINNTLVSVGMALIRRKIQAGSLIIPILMIHKLFWYYLGTNTFNGMRMPSLAKISEKIESAFKNALDWFSPQQTVLIPNIISKK